ncbi:MAG: AAA family ATPase [Planctomycetota bacterium]|nr:MAG: AAA family ATPase [Planctomycetota bacterium]
MARPKPTDQSVQRTINKDSLMYCEHWKLTCRPFENSCAQEFYYPAESHQATMLQLRYAIENRRSAVLMCGANGVGKTQVVRSMLEQLGSDYQPRAQIVFPALKADQFVHYLVQKLVGGEESGTPSVAADLLRFEQALSRAREDGLHPIVVVDEAHLLEGQGVFETLRLLLNLGAGENDCEAAWTLILSGHPILLSQLERFPSLDERIAVKCVISRFTPDETVGYIQHRVRAGGADADDIFAVTAMERIHVLTEGIPRRINRLCDLALMVGYAEDRKLITVDLVESVHDDLVLPGAT